MSDGSGAGAGEVRQDLQAMTDLEEALWGPEGGAVRVAVLDRLAGMTGRIRAAIDAGLPPKVYADANTIVAALATCREIMLLRR